jgi:hypothetical protein
MPVAFPAGLEDEPLRYRKVTAGCGGRSRKPCAIVGDRKPSLAEKPLLERIAYLTVRVRKLTEWGQVREADDATRLLATILVAFEKIKTTGDKTP